MAWTITDAIQHTSPLISTQYLYESVMNIVCDNAVGVWMDKEILGQ